MMDERRNPYLGPNTFGYEERHLFFGREREADELFSKVISERLVLFYAQSGAGKSSLLNARLRPRLEEEGFYVLPLARVSGEPPAEAGEVDNIFLFNLMFSLVKGKGDPRRLAHLSLADLLARLVSEDGVEYAFDETVAVPEAPAEGTEANPDRYVMIIDQFEEILTRHLDRWPEREEFFRQLNEAMERDPNLWVVLVLREDYVAGLSPYASLLANRMRGRYYMQRMTADGALEAIRGPAQLQPYNRPFAPGVAEQLADNLALVHTLDIQGRESLVPGEFVEPLQLQVVCYQLWANLPESPGRAITAQDLARLAGGMDLAQFVDRALADYYEAGIGQVVADAGLSVSEEQVREWFRENLITESGTRGMVIQGKEATGNRIRLPNEAVQRLEDHRLLRSETRAGGTWYELVHDRFIVPVLASNHAYLLRRAEESPLVKAAHDWEDAGRDPGLLWADPQLHAALQTAGARQQADATVADFLEAAQEAQRERDLVAEKRRARLRLRVSIALGLLSLLSVGLTVLALALAGENQGLLDQLQAEKDAAVWVQGALDSLETEQKLQFGKPVDGDTADGSVWGFEGEKGQLVSIEMTGDQDLDCWMDVRKPDGYPLEVVKYSEYASFCQSVALLPRDGLYFVEVSGIGPYTLMVNQPEAQPLSFDEQIVGATAEDLAWAFDGQAGQVVWIEMKSDTGEIDPYLELVAPDGNVLLTDDDSGGDGNSLIVVALPEDGTYRLLPTDVSHQRGSYSLLATQPAEQTLPFDEQMAGDTAEDLLWAFDGQAGQVVRIEMKSDTGEINPYLELRAPDGNVLLTDDDGGGDRNSLIVVALPEDGTYRLLPRDLSDQRGSYSLLATQPAPQPLEFGQSVAGDTAQNPLWTFEGRAGQAMRIEMTGDSDVIDPYLELWAPDGSWLGYDDDGGGGRNSRILVDLAQDGVYRLLARDYSYRAGPYELTLELEN